MGSQPKTIAIDFDGVIHRYSQGWKDGKIYDVPVHQCFTVIEKLFLEGYNVFILSTRSSRQIKKWLKKYCYESSYERFGMGNDPDDAAFPVYGFTVEVIPFWKKFWNKKGVLGITNRKLPAHCYIDDRAIRFSGEWYDTFLKVKDFRTWQEVGE